MTYGAPKCHNKNEAQQFGGFLAQHLPAEMTDQQMEYWRNHPEGLEAVLAGLKSPPVSTGAQAPLHVASPRIIDFHRLDGGVTRAVPLAFALVGAEYPNPREEPEVPSD